MSTFKVPLTMIRDIKAHPNADRLEIAKVYDWDVVVQKNMYAIGDWVIYVPVDSILSEELEAKLFPVDAKIKLHNRRIKSIKIRGQISQGMIISQEDGIPEGHSIIAAEEDCAELLGIKKYEQPVNSLPKGMYVKTSKKITNKNFDKYTEIENFKYYNDLFKDGDMIYISEKLHGTSFRAGYVLNEVNTIWKKALRFFHRLPKYEFCWGSKNVQIQGKLFHKGFYDEDVYTKMVKQYDLTETIPEGFVIYGEIVGHNIQKGYTYGCVENEHKLFIYDVKHDGEYLDYLAFKWFCMKYNLPMVPDLYTGEYHKNVIEKYRDGESIIGHEPIREGIVIKDYNECKANNIGRKVLKVISEGYYMLKDGTDFQ